MITASDIHYESGQHAQGLAGGGLGAQLPVADTNERLRASVRRHAWHKTKRKALLCKDLCS
jgi:hypothetical protein